MYVLVPVFVSVYVRIGVLPCAYNKCDGVCIEQTLLGTLSSLTVPLSMLREFSQHFFMAGIPNNIHKTLVAKPSTLQRGVIKAESLLTRNTPSRMIAVF